MKRFIAMPLVALLGACMSYPPPPAAPYRAVGQEPGWSLIIDNRDLTFIRQDGFQVHQPKPQVIGGVAGEIYQTPRIGVNIVHAPCTDSMSGQVYRDRVQVDVDGRRYEGCGGETAPAYGGSLANTSWRVTSVNGRPTPPVGDYFMNFEGNRVGSKFGCNSMGASYTQTGNVLDLGLVIATRIACQDMSFENAAGTILADPLNVAWITGNQVTLTNSRGRIDLRRSY